MVRNLCVYVDDAFFFLIRVRGYVSCLRMESLFRSSSCAFGLFVLFLIGYEVVGTSFQSCSFG